MKTVTRAQFIQRLLNKIAELTNAASTKEEAIAKGLKTFLTVEYAACYGGYRLVSEAVEGGTLFGAFGGNGMEPRQKFNAFRYYLNTLIAGIEAGIKAQQDATNSKG